MSLRPDFYLEIPLVVYNSLPDTMRHIGDYGDGSKHYIKLQCDSGDFVHTNITNVKTEVMNGYSSYYPILSPRQLKLDITLRETRFFVFQALDKTQEILYKTWESSIPQIIQLVDTITPSFDDDLNNGGIGYTSRYGIITVDESLPAGNYNNDFKTRKTTENNKIKFCFYELPLE